MPIETTTQRYLDPAVLAGISSLDLVAKTVVDGFIAGLHRSPDFGFSQEFAEYRAYTPGDDLRHVDWNVFARTERAYLKRYRGETSMELTVLLDASASMGFGSGAIRKLDYAKFLASSLVYLAHLQRDATGLLIFDEGLSNYVPASSRQGQLMRMLHAIAETPVGRKTDYAKLLTQWQPLLKRRGISVLISDFFAPPAEIMRTVEPLRYRGHELILFHLLDRQELSPELAEPSLLVDMESGESMEASPEYARSLYREKMAAHLDALKKAAGGADADYFLIATDRPLDEALREYLTIRQRRN